MKREDEKHTHDTHEELGDNDETIVDQLHADFLRMLRERDAAEDTD